MMNIRRTREIPEDAAEFFIGYAPPMPSRLARFVTRTVIGLACGVLAWAVTVAAGHVSLEGGTFEFGYPQRFAGTVVERPYPALRPDGVEPNTPWLLLVAPGKHGADALVSGLDGRHVTLTGTRILRGTHMMIEVEPASLVVGGGSQSDLTSSAIRAESFGDRPVNVRGEVVDSKCFLARSDGPRFREDAQGLCVTLFAGWDSSCSLRSGPIRSVVPLAPDRDIRRTHRRASAPSRR